MASSIRADADRAALLGLAVAIRLREGEGGREGEWGCRITCALEL